MLNIGSIVRVNYKPPCEEELSAHGIWPYVKGRLGRVIASAEESPLFPPSSDGHNYRVDFDDGRSAQYFKASELEEQPDA